MVYYTYYQPYITRISVVQALVSKICHMKHVAIYTTPTCGYCKMAKEFFAANNVPFEEYDVAANLEKRQEMVEKSGQMGVPVITVDDNLIIGFNKPRLAELLEVSA